VYAIGYRGIGHLATRTFGYLQTKVTSYAKKGVPRKRCDNMH